MIARIGNWRPETMLSMLEAAVAADVEAVLREHLGSVTDPGAPFKEAAKRITEDAHVHVGDDLVKVDASRGESRQILSDLFEPHRVGGVRRGSRPAGRDLP